MQSFDNTQTNCIACRKRFTASFSFLTVDTGFVLIGTLYKIDSQINSSCLNYLRTSFVHISLCSSVVQCLYILCVICLVRQMLGCVCLWRERLLSQFVGFPHMNARATRALRASSARQRGLGATYSSAYAYLPGKLVHVKFDF